MSSVAWAVKLNTVLVSPEVGVHVKSTLGGPFEGGGGDGAVTWTTCDFVDVRPPESIAPTTAVLLPAVLYRWLAVFVVDQAVSQLPSPVQSQRTWIELGESWSSVAWALKENTVVLLPEVGVQEKSTEGGRFEGGGGGGELESFQAVNGWSSQWYGPSQKTNPWTSREMLPFDCSWASVALSHDGTFGPQYPFPNQSRSISFFMYPLVVPIVMIWPAFVQNVWFPG